MNGRGRGPELFVVAGLIVASIAVAVAIVGQGNWIDDSFISFRYAKRLSEGHGLVYNPGDRVEGYTNFLWVVVAWVALELGRDPLRATQALSLVAQGLTLWATWRLSLRSAAPHGAAWLAPALLAFQASFVSYPMSGMETTLHTLLVTATMLAAAANAPVALGLLLACLALNRFDGFVFAAILWAHYRLLDRGPSPLPSAMRIFVPVFLGYHAIRILYYPDLLPNTFHAKVGAGPSQLVGGLRYAAGFFVRAAPLVGLLALLGATRRPTPVAALLRPVVACQIAYVIAVGGDWMPDHRFLLPVLPLLCVLAGDGFGRLAGRLGPAARPGFAALCVALAAVPLAFRLERGPDGLRFDARNHARWFDPVEAREIGRSLDRALPADWSVAVEWAGILPYEMRQRVLDTLGITDRAITSGPSSPTRYGRFVPLRELAARSPDVVVPCARAFPDPEAARASLDEGGSCRYRHYPRLLESRFGYRLCVFAVDGGSFWPGLVHESRDPAKLGCHGGENLAERP